MICCDDSNLIWKHEKKETDQITRSVIDVEGIKMDWRLLLLPIFLRDLFYFKKGLFLTRKNLLFTRKHAFKAAKEIRNGKTYGMALRLIEIKTKEIMDKDRKGIYPEKVRRKQLLEIQLLIDHYLNLLDTQASSYPEMVQAAYHNRKGYKNFLNKLQATEHNVILAATSGMRKGSKKERLQWFDKLRSTTKKYRNAELDNIFPRSS